MTIRRPKVKVIVTTHVDNDHDIALFQAGDAFNRMIQTARIKRYFDVAISHFISSADIGIDSASRLNYILPGDVPINASDRFTYDALVKRIKSDEESLDNMRRLFARLKRPSEPIDLTTPKGLDDGRERQGQGRLAVVKGG